MLQYYFKKIKRYPRQRECGVRSTVTIIARGGRDRYGDGEEQPVRKSKGSEKDVWIFVAIKVADQPGKI